VPQVTHAGLRCAFDVSLTIDDRPGHGEQVHRALAVRWGRDCRLLSRAHPGDERLPVTLGVRNASSQTGHEVQAHIAIALATHPGSSICGAPGIGLPKRADLSCARTPEEIALMRTLRTALDPRNVLNPRKVLAGTG
jgi:FAD/FMN-containing dehydrogenase